MARKVLAPRYLPSRLPFLTGAVLWLYTDRYDPAGWVIGVLWTLYALLALGSLYSALTEDDVHPSRIPEERS